jgi:hypothetical protein
MDDNGDNISGGSPALEATAYVDARASGDHISSRQLTIAAASTPFDLSN